MTSNRSLEQTPQVLGDRPALIVVDVINGFTDTDCPLGCNADDVVAANVALINRFHEQQLPVVLTTVVYRNDQQASVFRSKLPALNVLTPDSRWVGFDSRLPVLPSDIVIEKTHASGFHGTDLNAQLNALAVDSIVVTGLTTSGCVRATAVDGLQNNYAVFVAEEAVGDRNQAAHQANLFDLNAKYADVVSVDSILAALS